MVQLKIRASNGHGLFTTLLCLDASFAMTPYASSRSCRNSNQVLRPKPKNRSLLILRLKPPNPFGEAYPLCLLHNLDLCHRCPRLPDHQVLLRLCLTCSTTVFTWSTRSTPPHMYSCLLMSQSVSHPRSVFLPSWSLDPSLASIIHRS
jgi:hypothetical protein